MRLEPNFGREQTPACRWFKVFMQLQFPVISGMPIIIAQQCKAQRMSSCCPPTCVTAGCQRCPAAAQPLAQAHYRPSAAAVKVMSQLQRPALESVPHLLAVWLWDHNVVQLASERDLPEQQGNMLLQLVVNKVCCQVGKAADI